MAFAFDPGPEILEVTLRDGSYLIDFQFTRHDTELVAVGLEAVGLRWIEVGHGLGLNASRAGKGSAAATDEEYLEATANTLKRARWGMFFIPGIGRAEDLRLAARYRMSFVRIGTNITELEEARPYFELAKDLGFIVSYNPMKSYAMPPADFARKAALAASFGADVVYLVDSAGGMFPDEVGRYFAAARQETDVALGFHGHDNLSLVMANTLTAMESGAVLIDSSLQGMGRSAGNAVTEVLVAILKQRGLAPGIDLNGLMNVGQGVIRPLMRERGWDPLAITAGIARFHSSFTGKVQQYAQQHHVDARDLIIKLCERDRIGAPDELLEELSRELAARRSLTSITMPGSVTEGPVKTTGPEGLAVLLKELRPAAVKKGRHSTLNVVIGREPLEEFLVSRHVHESEKHVIGSVVVRTDAHLAQVLTAAEGTVDIVLLDVIRHLGGPRAPVETARALLEKTLLLTYLDTRVWGDAVEQQIVRLFDENIDGVRICVAGAHPSSRVLAAGLAARGARVALLRAATEEAASGILTAGIERAALSGDGGLVEESLNESAEAADHLARAAIVVVWPDAGAWFGEAAAARLALGTFLLDARVGGIRPEGLAEARRRGIRALRVNIWPTLVGTLAAAHDSAITYREAMGWGNLRGVPVVAGGAIGERGDVVVDSIKKPTRILGIADGLGSVGFSYGREEADRVRTVSEEINTRKVSPQLDILG